MKIKYLITGAGGFVGRHLLKELETVREPIEIVGLDRRSPLPDVVASRHAVQMVSIDLSDRKAVETVVSDFEPQYIIHLAASSSVSESWQNPVGCISNNVILLLNLLESVRVFHSRTPQKPCRILAVGSADVYDTSSGAMPYREEQAAQSPNPYALSRLMQEQIVRFYVDNFGLDVVSTRSFMHIGPGQEDRFAIASFIKQLRQAGKAGASRAILKTGNVDLKRDISDVRDVVRAYLQLLFRGRKGEIYNVCRGEAVSLREVIRIASSIINIDAVIEVDVRRLRPNDPEIVTGCNEKIRKETGWTPDIPLERTILDMINAENRGFEDTLSV